MIKIKMIVADCDDQICVFLLKIITNCILIYLNLSKASYLFAIMLSLTKIFINTNRLLNEKKLLFSAILSGIQSNIF